MRLAIGDVDPSAPLVYDEELDVYLGDYSNSILKTSAAVCEMLAVKFARYYDFETDGQKFARSQMSKQYATLAQSLKNRATGLAALDTTRVDGYSQDVATSEVGSSADNPRQKYVTFTGLDQAP